jgi:nitrogen fixation/metabolism regulation signal transduction histidine kinase
VIALSLSDLPRNRVVLRSELAEDFRFVIGDCVQLQRVILNLLRNASDARGDVKDWPRALLIRAQREGVGDKRIMAVANPKIVTPLPKNNAFGREYLVRAEPNSNIRAV